MDTSPPKPSTYTRVVPLKGKLKELKNAFEQQLKNGKQQKHAEDFSEFPIQFVSIVGQNRVKTEDSGKNDGVIKFESLQEVQEQPKAPDNKIIIQKVEKVTIDVSSLLFSPGKGDKKIPEASTSKAQAIQNDATQEKSVAISQGPPKKPNGTMTVSLPASKCSENEFNTKVPLKVVQTIKRPKPKPNLPARVHRVQTFRPSQVPPAKLPEPEVKIEPAVPQPIVIKKEEPVAKKVIVKAPKSDTDGSDCCGFDVDSADPAIMTTKYYDFLKQDEAQKSEIESEKNSTLVVKTGSPSKASPAKRTTRQSSIAQENEIIKKPKPQEAPKPSSTKARVNAPVKKPESNSWQNDILAVIGTTRLKEIDEMLKNIPNIIDNDFNPIEMENVELKLIIKHLLRKLKVDSITDTLKPGDSKPSFSSGGLLLDFAYFNP